MAIRENREYRFAPIFEVRAKDEQDESYIVEGYATTFNDEYVLMTDGEGNEYKETVIREAFDDNTDTKDVIFVKDHEGTVFARTKNNTLVLSLDDHGLKVTADLSKTSSARAAYEEIKSGMYDQMSFAFIVDDDDYDKKKRLRTIRHISKLFDVSFVGFPANPNTDISVATRDYFNGVIEMEQAERLAELEARQKLELEKMKLKAKLNLEV